jgi:hypothetical protein
MKVVADFLDYSGIGRDRLCLRWVSAAEGQQFAEYVTEYSALIGKMGPFFAEDFSLALSSIKRSLASSRIRWLMAADPELGDRKNVYGKRLDRDGYQNLLQESVLDEYQKGLILEVMKAGPCSVREIAMETGLPVYTVSQRVGDLERCRQADFAGYDGRIAKYVSIVT